MSQRPRRIAFVLDTLEVGGIQRQLLEVCRALVGSGWQVRILCLRSDGAAMEPQFRAAGCRVKLLGKQQRFDWAAIMRLREALRTPRPHVVHAMTPQSAIWCSIVLPFRRRPAFVGAFLNTFAFDKELPRWAERLIVRPRLDAVLVNSRAARRLYKKRISDGVPIACIHNGVAECPPVDRVALRGSLGFAASVPLIVAVGRLVPVKGLEFLIRAFARIAPQHPEARVCLIGDGPLRKSLGWLATRLGVVDRVHFLGEREEPMALLPAFDILVLPSLSEGLPNALLEGMSAGLACVASRVGGIPEIGDKSGVALVEPGDIASLAEAIGRFVENQGERLAAGEASRRCAAGQFPMQKMIDRTLSMYEKVLRKNGARR